MTHWVVEGVSVDENHPNLEAEMDVTTANTTSAPSPKASLCRLRRTASNSCLVWVPWRPLLRFAKMVCTPIKVSVSKPITILVHQELSDPINWIRACVTAKTNTPNNVPNTYPVPPVNIVPPITTEAITSNSKPDAYK